MRAHSSSKHQPLKLRHEPLSLSMRDAEVNHLSSRRHTHQRIAQPILMRRHTPNAPDRKHCSIPLPRDTSSDQRKATSGDTKRGLGRARHAAHSLPLDAVRVEAHSGVPALDVRRELENRFHVEHSTRARTRAQGISGRNLGDISHRNVAMAQSPPSMPHPRRKSRDTDMPTMRRHHELPKRPTTQQRRSRPHRAPRTRRSRFGRKPESNLQAMQPGQGRTTSEHTPPPHIPRMVTQPHPGVTNANTTRITAGQSATQPASR